MWLALATAISASPFFKRGEQFVIGAGIGPGDFQAVALEDPGVARHVHRQLADVPGRVVEDTDGLTLSGVAIEGKNEA